MSNDYPILSNSVKLTNSLIIFEKVWYNKLIDGLLNYIDKPHVIICYTKKQNKYFAHYYYANFDSYIEFYHYHLKFNISHRSFYEVIHSNQKLYFDIDVQKDSFINTYFENDINDKIDLLIETIIKSCKMILEPNILSLEKDVLIYTSHGENKFSYHIIIDHWYVENHIEAKYFFEKVYKYTEFILKGKYVEFIDNSVYTSNQLLRIVGCHKFDNMRIKKFESSFKYDNKIIHHQSDFINDDLNEFCKSLITMIDNCKPLQSFKEDKEENIPIKKIYNNLTEKNINDIQNLLNKQFGNLFVIRDIKNNIINLTRKKPFKCIVCNRIHTHENPRLIIMNKNVMWDCRRNEYDKKLNLGCLDIIDENENNHINEQDHYILIGDQKIDINNNNNVVEQLKNIKKKTKSNQLVQLILDNDIELDKNNNLHLRAISIKEKYNMLLNINCKTLDKNRLKKDVDNLCQNNTLEQLITKLETSSNQKLILAYLIKKNQF